VQKKHGKGTEVINRNYTNQLQKQKQTSTKSRRRAAKAKAAKQDKLLNKKNWQEAPPRPGMSLKLDGNIF